MTTNKLVNSADLFRVKEWENSKDSISFYKVSEHSWDISNEIAKFLVSTKPNFFFPMVNGASVDQHVSWMAEQGNIHNQGGFRLVARHSFHEHYPIIGVLMAEYLPRKCITVVVKSVGYEGTVVDDILTDKANELIDESGRLLVDWEK